MFLSPAQVAKLARTGSVQIGLIEEKVLANGLSCEDAQLVQIEAAESFDPTRYQFSISRSSGNDYFAAPTNIKEAVELLEKDPTVLSVYLSVRPKPVGLKTRF
jgi:hypothetical protein